MFGSGQRSSLGGASPGPGVGAYDLRGADGVYAFRPGTSPVGASAKRQPLGGAPARGVPPPTQYVGHADPFTPVSFFGDTRRRAYMPVLAANPSITLTWSPLVLLIPSPLIVLAASPLSVLPASSELSGFSAKVEELVFGSG